MKSGEACWVYCDGASDYQGPLAVTIPMGTGLAFGNSGSGQVKILLSNNSTDPMVVSTGTSDGGLPLAYVLRSLAEDRIEPLFSDLPASYSMPVMETGQQSVLRLQVRRERMAQNFQSSLLKISSDNGVRVWLPVAAQREDLGNTP
jgi:hypothetical protein